MTQHGMPTGGTPRVDELSPLARALMARAGDDPGPLRLTQVRCKPGRGTVARLRPERGPHPGEEAGAAVWLSVETTGPDGSVSGMAVHGFGDDYALPALRAASAPEPQGEVWGALEEAARVRLDDPGRRLVAVDAVPVRYKPGSRCVLRYRLHTEGGEAVTVFGKLFAEPLQAVAVDAITRRLHAEQAAGGEPPVVPRPLGAVEGAGLALTAAGAEGDGFLGPLHSGIRVLLPRRHHGADGVPSRALVAAAEAIGRLHRSGVGLRGGLGVVRTPAQEARRCLDRAALLGHYASALEPQIAAAAAGVAARLSAATCEAMVPCHGGFKPSQLVYSAPDRVVLTDLDGICLADPALDLGYFLAYLRPLSVWTDRPAVATWFAFASACFLDAYARSMQRAGAPPHLVESSLRRVPLYEAALLLKIAARRPQRLNAPRAAELSATLDDIHLCLSATRRAA